jgi:hypothetical protein
VRWPAKNSGAFVFGLNFWFFWFKPKEQKRFYLHAEGIETYSRFFIVTFYNLLSFLCLETKKRNKRKFKDKRMAPPVCPAKAHAESL